MSASQCGCRVYIQRSGLLEKEEVEQVALRLAEAVVDYDKTGGKEAFRKCVELARELQRLAGVKP